MVGCFGRTKKETKTHTSCLTAGFWQLIRLSRWLAADLVYLVHRGGIVTRRRLDPRWPHNTIEREKTGDAPTRAMLNYEIVRLTESPAKYRTFEL
ncbi:unnamed protein product [Caenorhabditis auriculariae]|uniref:Uncharacterized protein n=1 Tax=Caenorhabditis auriculariae TaxID=2777116 RepID=A0A8S1GWX1_9PELO|nr:unnamed protein product [Caenorhabditis auriculariae]